MGSHLLQGDVMQIGHQVVHDHPAAGHGIGIVDLAAGETREIQADVGMKMP